MIEGDSMHIIKILNNNAVQVINEHGDQVIIVGRGIGHDKKRGQTISIENSDEVFVMTNRNLFPSVKNILTSVSTDLIETSNKIINYGKKLLDTNLNQNIIISLTDHLDYAISKARDGIYTPNPLNLDIKKFYPTEYKIGEYALKVVKKYQFTILREDEAGFIAMHFVDATIKDNKSTHNIMRLTEALKKVLAIVEKEMPNISKDSLAYSRFVRHIQYMIIRIFENGKETNEIDADIAKIVFEKYPFEYSLAKKIRKVILHDFQVDINDEEQMYITIHLARLADVRGEQI